MAKYFQIFKLTIQEYFVYRLNFLLLRFRSFISFFAALIFWAAIYGSKSDLFGYSKAQMIAYVIGVAFLRGIVLSSRSADLAGKVRSGELNKLLLRPFKVIPFWFTCDMADKSLNIGFAVVEIILAVWLLKLPLYFPQDPKVYALFVMLVGISLLLYFFISFCLSTLAFWTEDVWATRWLFGIIFLEFLSGAYFPIDVLPQNLSKIIYLTPFPYLVYFPLKVWLGQVSLSASVQVLVISFAWLVVFYFLSSWLWGKGFKKFGAYGG